MAAKSNPFADLARDIRCRMAYFGITSIATLASISGIGEHRLRTCMANPERFTYGELLKLSKLLKLEIMIKQGGNHER